MTITDLAPESIQGADHIHPFFRRNEEKHESAATGAGYLAGQGPGLDRRFMNFFYVRIGNCSGRSFLAFPRLHS
jgi:hypothetical protein